MKELSELRSQLLARYDRGIRFLLDHYMGNHEAGAATLICDHAARRVLRGEVADRDHPAHTIRQACFDYIDDYATGPASGAARAKRSSREMIALLDSLGELDREVVLRYYLARQEKSIICRALELSEYHFDQIVGRAKTHYVRAEPDRNAIPQTSTDERDDMLDRFILGQLSSSESVAAEIAILERPALAHEAQNAKDLVTDLRNAHLPRRWRRRGEWQHPDAKARLIRRRRSRGLWRFLTRPCIGAAASILCVVGIFASWAMWDAQRIAAIVNQPATFAATTSTIPLRVAQTRGFRPSALLELAGRNRIISVTLDIGEPQNSRYQVTLLDTAGEMRWQQRGIVPGGDEMLRFVVSSDVLETGVQRFLVEPTDGPGHRIQLAFQVDTVGATP